MRRQVQVYRALSEPILIMGMPPVPFLAVTTAAALLPVFGRFHPLSFGLLVLYPALLAALRRLGRQDPERLRILVQHATFYRRFYHPVGHLRAGQMHLGHPRPIDRRSHLP